MDNKLKILFVSFGSKWYNDVWNVLSIETLLGDVNGYFKDQLASDTVRFFEKKDILNFIKNRDINLFDIIALSLDIGSDVLFYSFLEELKSLSYKGDLVCGGTLSTYAYDYIVKKDVVSYNKPIFVIGDGEIVLRAIINCKLNQNDYLSLPNTYQYDLKTNEYVLNQADLVDLNELIYPPCSINNIPDSHIRIIQASRNCVFNCTYCSQGPKKMWRSFSMERIRENIDNLMREGVYEFEFVDDEFFGGTSSKNIDRAWEIANIISTLVQKHGKNIRFRIFTNPHIISSENKGTHGINFLQLLERLKGLGLTRVYLGIESGSEAQRKRYNRKDTINECIASIKLLDSLNIAVDAGFIMFDPEVTIQDVLENIKFISENNILKYNTWPLRPIILTAKTPMFHRAEKLGLIVKRNEVNIASFDYIFSDEKVRIIYRGVDDIANCSSKVFYILKYFYKENFYTESRRDELNIINSYLIKNAEVNFNYIKDMVVELESSGSIYNSTKSVLQQIYDLITSIEKNISIFDLFNYPVGNLTGSIMDTKKNLEDLGVQI